MSGVTSADRQMAWNIRILECPPNINCTAGAIQCGNNPSSIGEIFSTIFDFKPYLASSAGVLALWVRNSDEVVVHDLPNSSVSYSTESNSDRSNVLSRFVKVGNVSCERDDDPLQTQLHLSLVLHDNCECDCEEPSLDFHVRSGTA